MVNRDYNFLVNNKKLAIIHQSEMTKTLNKTQSIKMIKIFEKAICEFNKFFYRITHPKSYHHNRKRWPYVKIERAKNGEIVSFTYKKQKIDILPISHLKNKFNGEILLIATGPSINSIDFKNVNIPVFGVNGAYKLKNVLNFNFYIITDEHFFEHRPNILLDVISNPEITLFIIIDVLTQILDHCGKEELKCSIVIIENICAKIYRPKLKIEDLDKDIFDSKTNFLSSDNPNIAFTTDITNGIFAERTVIYWALQVISFLNYNKIYIAGLDMNNFDKPRFYETENDKIPTQLKEDFDGIMSGFQLASHVFKLKNIEVINLSMQSAIPDSVFVKSDYRYYFS